MKTIYQEEFDILYAKHKEFLKSFDNDEEIEFDDARRLWITGASIHADMRGYDLRRVVLQECNFNMSKLGGANFSDSILSNSQFDYCRNSNEVNFKNANLIFSSFDKARVANSNFNNATLSNSFFEGAYLNGSTFRYAYLVDCNFAGAIMDKVDFFASIVANANFQGASLHDTNIHEAVNFRDIKLRGSCGVQYARGSIGRHNVTVIKDHVSIGCSVDTVEGWLQTGWSRAYNAGYTKKEYEQHKHFVLKLAESLNIANIDEKEG